MRILVVEDEEEIRNVLAAYLRREGWEVDVSSNGNEALQLFDLEKHSFVILDLKLEGLNGERVCELIREKSDVPIMMLTSKTLESDIIKGFGLGADDYVAKPFRVKEVVVRVKAIFKRLTAKEAPAVTSFDGGAMKVDQSSGEVIVCGKRIKLTTTEFKLLKVLAGEPLKVFSRSDLMYKALGYRFQVEGRSLDVHVKNLRKKIEADNRNPRYIETVVGMGYRFTFHQDE